MRLINLLFFSNLLLFSACSSNIADQYIDAINETTEAISKATNYDDIKNATKKLIDFEHTHREALNNELKDNKLKQAEVDKAYKEFMQTGMNKSFELGTQTNSIPRQD